MKLFRTALPVLLLASIPAFAGAPGAHWLEPLPARSRAGAVKAMQALLTAESRRDWPAIYEMRPELDRETESEKEFERRWQEMSKATVLDFQPQRSVVSTFGGEKSDEQVFDVLGCAKVSDRDETRFQLGSVSAHLTEYGWALDGVHLMTNDDEKPEPCTFHAGEAVLASAKSR